MSVELIGVIALGAGTTVFIVDRPEAEAGGTWGIAACTRE